jgi:hypothetical protein
MLSQNISPLGKPIATLCLSLSPFSSSRAGREKQGRSRSEGAMRLHNPVPECVERRGASAEGQSRASSGADERIGNRLVGQLACQRVWFGSAAWLAQALPCFVSFYPCPSVSSVVENSIAVFTTRNAHIFMSLHSYRKGQVILQCHINECIAQSRNWLDSCYGQFCANHNI